MKAYVKMILIAVGITTVMMSCQCKVCRKSGENDVKVCRDNYQSDGDYNQALGWYQLAEYSCENL